MVASTVMISGLLVAGWCQLRPVLDSGCRRAAIGLAVPVGLSEYVLVATILNDFLNIERWRFTAVAFIVIYGWIVYYANIMVRNGRVRLSDSVRVFGAASISFAVSSAAALVESRLVWMRHTPDSFEYLSASAWLSNVGVEQLVGWWLNNRLIAYPYVLTLGNPARMEVPAGMSVLLIVSLAVITIGLAIPSVKSRVWKKMLHVGLILVFIGSSYFWMWGAFYVNSHGIFSLVLLTTVFLASQNLMKGNFEWVRLLNLLLPAASLFFFIASARPEGSYLVIFLFLALLIATSSEFKIGSFVGLFAWVLLLLTHGSAQLQRVNEDFYGLLLTALAASVALLVSAAVPVSPRFFRASRASVAGLVCVAFFLKPIESWSVVRGQFGLFMGYPGGLWGYGFGLGIAALSLFTLANLLLPVRNNGGWFIKVAELGGFGIWFGVMIRLIDNQGFRAAPSGSFNRISLHFASSAILALVFFLTTNFGDSRNLNETSR